jgi:hypothetical protein
MKTYEQLVSDHAALLAPEDLPGNLTPAERDAYEGRRSTLAGRVRTAQQSRQILAEWRPRLDADTAYRDALSAIRDEKLCKELFALAKPRTDLEFGTQINVRLSIMACDRGLDVAEGSGWQLSTLRLGHFLTEANITWQGCLPDVERRIADAKSRVDDATARLTDALLDDEERRIADAGSAARAAAFNSLSKAEKKAAHNRKCGYAVDERGVA